jgi:hypothetical protein
LNHKIFITFALKKKNMFTKMQNRKAIAVMMLVAMMAMLSCQRRGVGCPTNFGKAPQTEQTQHG